MSWMLPAVTATLTGTFVLAATYSYLATRDKHSFLEKWAIGWWCYVLRFVFLIIIVKTGPNSLLQFGSQAASLANGYFLLWGTCEFLGKRMSRVWSIGFVILLCWIVFGSVFGVSFFLLTVPAYACLGTVYIFTGIAFLKTIKLKGFWVSVSGWCFILWGVHKLDYPFISTVDWLAPWGFFVASLLEIIVAMGMLLLYFEKNRSELQATLQRLQWSEDIFNQAQGIAHFGSWEWDIQEDKWFWSDEIYRQFGLEPDQVVPCYATFARFVHPEDLNVINSGVRSTVEKGGLYSVDVRMYKSDGAEWIMHSEGVIQKNNMGVPLKITGIQQDITEQVTTRQTKIALEKKLRQAQKMEAVGTLAGGIAHDFNNILGAILGYAEIAREDISPASPVATYLDKILLSSNRAKNLVKQILTFSRQSGVERVNMKIQPVLQEAMSMLRSSIPTTIEIVEDIDDRCKPVKADPTQIHQIVMNLCTNAFHAMEERGGKLSVSLQPFISEEGTSPGDSQVPAGEYIQLIVTDTGQGITREMQHKIFDPYFTTKEIGKGTGLGLSTVHGIVRDHGGSIIVKSNKGNGAAFHVFFPVAHEEIASSEKTQAFLARKKIRILLVDDEPLLVAMGKDMLERLGYSVISMQNSLEALWVFQKDPHGFDVVITDQTMPGMSGFDLAGRMILIRADIPVILCTGFWSSVDENAARSIGIKGFAHKPFSTSEIAELIYTVLNSRESQTCL